MRVHELAKKIGISPKELMELLEKHGMSKKTSSNNVEDWEINILKEKEPWLFKSKEEIPVEEVNEEGRVFRHIRSEEVSIPKKEENVPPEVTQEIPAPPEKETSVPHEETEEHPPEAEEQVETRELPTPEEIKMEETEEVEEEKPSPELLPVEEEEFGKEEEEEIKFIRKEEIKQKIKALEEELRKKKGIKRPEKKRKEVFTMEEIYDEVELKHKIQAQKRKKLKKEAKPTPIIERKPEKRIIKIEEGERFTPLDLSRKLGVKVEEVLRKLANLGLKVGKDEPLDADALSVVAGDYGYEVQVIQFNEDDYIDRGIAPPEEMEPRAPVVTVMGHVDHGKTTLLDRIRKTNVAEREVGGITQSIGASTVVVNGRKIVFIDTPGHEAFTAMRARGAMATDIVVLVVAADDGVMPQTVEAINHAKAAGVPIVVAINKIDKPEAKPNQVKQQLAQYELIPEEWGGNTLFVEISAKTGKGIENLFDAIFLQAEMLDLKAPYNRKGMGIIIESKMDHTRGPVASVIVRSGRFLEGNYFVAGNTWGKIRAMFDDRRNRVKEAGPSSAVEIIGFSELVSAGEFIYAVENEEIAKKIVERRKLKTEGKEALLETPVFHLIQQIKEETKKEIRLVLKGDTYGSMNAIVGPVERLSTDEVKVKILHSGVGNITESDVMLALASNGLIVGFNVKVDPNARELARMKKVEIRVYNIIYDLIEDIRKAVEGMLKPVETVKILGRAEVRQVFTLSQGLKVAGSYVLEGKIVRNSRCVLKRNGEEVYRGKIASLRRFKEDMKEVEKGYECGIAFDGFSDIKVGDIIECYEKEVPSPE